MASPVSTRYTRLAATSVATIAGTTLITLQIGADPGAGLGDDQHRVKVIIQRVKLRRIAGTAANFTPRIFSTSVGPPAAGDIEQEYQGALTVVGTLFDATSINAICYTDNRGALYLQPGPDAAADNQFKYAIYFEILN